MNPPSPPRPFRKRALRIAAEAAVVVVLVVAVGVWQTRHLPTDVPAPALSLRTLDGRTINNDTFTGKTTLVVFWAPWCTVCAAASGNVSWVHEHAPASVQVVSIASDYKDVSDVQRYVDKHDVHYPVALGGARTARAFHVQAFPTTFVVNERGDIERAVVGYTTTLGLLARAMW